MVDWIVFVIGAVVAIAGSAGVLLARNSVHSALMLVMTLFGVAVLFVSQQAHFLAAVQVIVYAGAIVVLFLFVIMLLGVDRTEDTKTENLRAQRPIAAVIGLLAVAELILISRVHFALGARPVAAVSASGAENNIEKIGRAVFTRYLFAFEITSVLLVIAVIGAVVLARKPKGTAS